MANNITIPDLLAFLARELEAAGLYDPTKPVLVKDCANCFYMQIHDAPEEGHCYMFRDEPDGNYCGQMKQKQ